MARRDHDQGTDQGLRGPHRRRRPRPRHPHRRVLRPARPERRRQDDHRRDRRGLPRPRRRRGARARHRPPGRRPRRGATGSASCCRRTGGLDLLTPREALASTAKAYSHPRDVDDVLASVGLDDKADARIVGLSGGQRRRLDVALGIVGRPELLFLDEPTTGSTPRPAATSGTSSAPSPPRARRSCSRRTTSTRPRTSPTGSASSPPAGCSPSTPPRRSVAAAPRRPRSPGRRTASGTASPPRPPPPRSRGSRPGCRTARSRPSPSPGPRSRTPTSP